MVGLIASPSLPAHLLKVQAPLRDKAAQIFDVYPPLGVYGRIPPLDTHLWFLCRELTAACVFPFIGKSLVSEPTDEIQEAEVGRGRFRLATKEKGDTSH